MLQLRSLKEQVRVTTILSFLCKSGVWLGFTCAHLVLC